ncbi:collagen alpha-1(XII) chain-like [Lineus longissimus]|uniref:collagen alpha-1(XII) chain-like n=1 Tax=Lineus longissimus TaxID=88925 RepID=UPI00315D3194
MNKMKATGLQFVVIFTILCQIAAKPTDNKEDTIPGSKAPSIPKSDIIFVLDASSSVTIERFDAMRSFIGAIMTNEIEKLGSDQTQVGLVMFSTDVVKNVPLNKYTKIEGFNEELSGLTYVRGETNLGKALRFVRTKALQSGNGYRPSVPHVAVIVTDGWVSDIPLAKDEIKRLRDRGVYVIVVGIGQYVDRGGLRSLGINSVRAESWTGLVEALPDLRKKAAHSDSKKINRCGHDFKANVIFVVDSSHSIGEANFKTLKTFLLNVVRAFKVIGKNGVQVGMVQYSSYDKTKVLFNLDTYNDRKSLESAIGKLRWTKGGTKTGYAMRLAEKSVAQQASRKDVHDNFIVVTDGKANDRVEFAAARLHKANYTVLAVGIGKSVDGEELRAIASEPKEVHVFRPGDFSQLPWYLSYIITEVCRPVDVVSKQQKTENIEVGKDSERK